MLMPCLFQKRVCRRSSLLVISTTPQQCEFNFARRLIGRRRRTIHCKIPNAGAIFYVSLNKRSPPPRHIILFILLCSREYARRQYGRSRFFFVSVVPISVVFHTNPPSRPIEREKGKQPESGTEGTV